MENTARALLGAGLVSLNIFDPVTQAYLGFGESVDADKFEIQPGFEEKTSTSKSHLDYGQARASVVLPKPTELNITIAAASAAALALQFQGITQSLTQGSATVTAEAKTLLPGVNAKLSKRNINEAGFVVKNAATPATVYVRGADYIVNYSRGEIRAVVGGAIAVSTAVTIDFTANAIDGTEILGGRNPQIRVQARFDGVNMVDRRPLEVDIREAVLGASNGFDFLADNFNGIQLKGKIVTPIGFSEGYVVRQL